MKRYEDEEYKRIRQKVLKRDRYKCQMPGCKHRSRLQIHHIIMYSKSVYLRSEPDNLITLCFNCHKSIRGKESFFITLFSKIVHDNNSR
jgi:5-methylcytosine-specific restriction protein A